MAYDPDPKGDSWYKWKGVTPPERTSHGLTEDEIDSVLAKNKHKCVFEQRGNEIFCEVGDYRHGHFVNPRLEPIYRK